jgi:hypothetical protein
LRDSAMSISVSVAMIAPPSMGQQSAAGSLKAA